MAEVSDQTTIGLSERAHDRLKRLKEDGHFAEMIDGYRFAIALALAHGAMSDEVQGKRVTIFNIGSLKGEITDAVRALSGTGNASAPQTIERLAEWGVTFLDRMASEGRLSFSEILEEAEALVDSGDAR